MSSNTKHLGLLKKDPIIDKNETFNIQTMLNENWDKIDDAVEGGFLQSKAYIDEQINLVTATGIPKLVSYPLQVTATEDKQTAFEIPLDTFDVATDTLLVVINRAFLDASQYTVKNGTRDAVGEVVKRAEITLARGVAVGSEISLLVLKNVPIGEGGSINGAVLAVDSVPVDRVSGLQDKLNEAFQAGNERKSELVAALIAKGITATIYESWADLIDKVDSIAKAVGNATSNDIRQGKKATTDAGEIIGILPERGVTNIFPKDTTQKFSKGIYSDFTVSAPRTARGTTMTIWRGANIGGYDVYEEIITVSGLDFKPKAVFISSTDNVDQVMPTGYNNLQTFGHFQGGISRTSWFPSNGSFSLIIAQNSSQYSPRLIYWMAREI